MFLPVLEGSACTVIARNTGVRSSQYFLICSVSSRFDFCVFVVVSGDRRVLFATSV